MPDSRLTVLHVVRSPIGGIFRHIADLAAAQSAAGHQVGVVCDSLTGGEFEAAQIAALAPRLAHGVTRIPMRRAPHPADFVAMRDVRRLVARMRPDVIHAHGAKGGLYGRLAARAERRRGRNVVAFYAPHGGSLHYDPKTAQGRRYFAAERLLERLTDGLVHASDYERRAYRDKVGPPQCPAHVVHNGIRPEEFEPVVPQPDAVDFLFIGMLRDLKGTDLFIAAMAELDRRGRPSSALIVGDGEAADLARYRDMAAAAGLGSRLRFAAPMPARQAFAAARTVVVPSRAESLPYIVLEAAAAGMPIIASDVGGIPEIFAGEEHRLVGAGDAAALADAMAAALAEPERFSGEAAARRERLRGGFSLATMAARIEALYREALQRRAHAVLRRAYRRWAPIYDVVFGRMMAAARRRAAAAAERVGGRALEVGVGTGIALPAYGPGLRVVGIDLSYDMLRRAARRINEEGLDRVDGLAVMDAARLGFADRSFDVAAAMFVITVVPDAEAVLAELARVVRPGGEVVVVSHFASAGGLRAGVERLLSGRSGRLGWQPDFPVEAVLGRPGLRLVERTALGSLGLFTLLRFRCEPAAIGDALSRADRAPC